MLDKKLKEILEVLGSNETGDPVDDKGRMFLSKPELLEIMNDKKLTGEEWLDRFIIELESFIDTNRRTQDFTDAVLAARKASGVEK